MKSEQLGDGMSLTVINDCGMISSRDQTRFDSSLPDDLEARVTQVLTFVRECSGGYRYEGTEKSSSLDMDMCNANCFAALSLVELMIEENSQILEEMDESTRSQFWDRMKKQLLELKSLMSVVKTKCEEMKNEERVSKSRNLCLRVKV